MKGFFHSQSKGKKAVKLHRLGSGSMSITTMCTSTTTTTTTTTTVPPLAASAKGTSHSAGAKSNSLNAVGFCAVS